MFLSFSRLPLSRLSACALPARRLPTFPSANPRFTSSLSQSEPQSESQSEPQSEPQSESQSESQSDSQTSKWTSSKPSKVKLSEEEVKTQMEKLAGTEEGGNRWRIANIGDEQTQALFKLYPFKGIGESLSFVRSMVAMSQKSNHHPRLTLDHKSVEVGWWTHSVGGLCKRDFEMAASTDARLRWRQTRPPNFHQTRQAGNEMPPKVVPTADAE